MYLLIIGWMYVALMMAVAEAANPVGTVLGAVITFLLYGVTPVALLMYLLGRPSRKNVADDDSHQNSEASASKAAEVESSGADADRSGEATTDPVTPVRKEP
jgi:hypothetical protein